MQPGGKGAPPGKHAGACPSNITWQHGAVDRAFKQRLLKQRGCVVWFTGLSGSGKSTVAIALEHALARQGRLTMLLDGDNIRHGLSNNLGFSPSDREENIRRIGEVAKLMMETGVVTLTSFISPYARDRQMVRSRLPEGDFIEVYMNVPLKVCEERDTKGLYKLARSGKLKCFTGIDDPYETPQNAEIVLSHLHPDGTERSPQDMAGTVLNYLDKHGCLHDPSCSIPPCVENTSLPI